MVNKMLKNQKRVFWEALLVTFVVFIFGILLGISYESIRVSDINDYYAKSEISLMDILAFNNLVDLENARCKDLIDSNIEFADRIYEEAILLEDLENLGKVTDDLEITHKRYDLLRTFLWINTIKAQEKCSEDFSTVVYIYDSKNEDLTVRATQKVWSKILYELKEEKGSEIILIPIANDGEIESLNFLVNQYNITKFPVVIINNKIFLNELSTVEELNKALEE